MNDKEKFITEFKLRTKKFAVDIISLCDNLKATKAASVVSYQIIKSATSVGANYRAACRGRSKAEFYSKICIVVEEADETEYWLELILETNLSKNNHEVIRLLKESNEITKILTKAKSTTYMNN
ncbi:MAG: four helix bundle protein [Saprospiraceae bacterium]|jgi:four helix bundle protein|nr:four helix bundle protein [Saprospiraceae bacterium]